MNVWMPEEGYGSWRMDVGASGISPGQRGDKRRLRGLMPLVLRRRPQITSASQLPDPPGWQPFTLSDTRAPFYAPSGGLTACCVSQVCLHLCYLYICVFAASPPPSPSCSVIKTLFHWSRECTQRSGYKFIRWMLTLPFFFFPSFFTARHAGDALIGERRDICIRVCATHATAELMQSNPCRTVIHFPEGEAV